MNKRPSSSDTEHDILKMQNDFVLEKNKNTNFHPAAKVVKFNKAATRKPSSFAKKRGLVKSVTDSSPAIPASTGEIIGDIVERPIKDRESTMMVEEKTIPRVDVFSAVLGDIIERKTVSENELKYTNRDSGESGFPKAVRISRIGLGNVSAGKSLFSVYRANSTQKPINLDDTQTSNEAVSPSTVFGSKSYILSNEMASSIHKENVEQLEKMDQSEILAERQQLIASLDPDLIKFLQSKRAVASTPQLDMISESTPISDTPSNTMDTVRIENEATLDIMLHPNYKDWPNFDIVQPQKLQWMNDIAANLPALKPGETFEARFDWKGVLLPYVMSGESDADRELYLHGDDAERPGYTLQELFRLARSNIVQQRISAIGSVAGILNIYSQGFYDTMLELPISKIFFLLRYAFDENIPAILEITSKALATLFYCESDEVLLDFIHERSISFCEPSFAQNGRVGEKPVSKAGLDLSDEFAKINLEKSTTSPKFETNLENNEDGDDRESLNDFHLAEVDLVDCVLRTNLIQRINYVLFTVKPDNSTVLSCFKLLIRLARNDKVVAETILRHQIMEDILLTFLPAIDGISLATKFYAKPQHLALKLIRIIAAYGCDFCQVLLKLGISDILKNYIFVRTDLSIDLIKLQVEAFRAGKVIMLLSPQSTLYSELTPALLYLLEWCYQFLKFDQTGHVLLRQHAATLITFIGCGRAMSDVAPFADKLTVCFSKWFHQAGVHGIVELSQNILLATCLDVCTHYVSLFKDFYASYLSSFLQTPAFAQICDDLCNQSPLLQKSTVRLNKHAPLPDLNAVVMNAKGSSAFLFTQKYPMYLLESILHLLTVMASHRTFTDLLARLSMYYLDHGLQKYVSLLSKGANKNLSGNWFIQSEVVFVMRLIMENRTVLEKNEMQKAAFNVSVFLTENNVSVLVELFSRIIFDISMYPQTYGVTQADMLLWRDNYQIQMIFNIRRQKNGFNISNHDKCMLPTNWPYKLLLIMFRADSNTVAVPPSDRVLITACVSLTSLQQANGIQCVSPTEELLFLMMAFLGKEASFLDDDIKQILSVRVQAFFDQNCTVTFQLDQQFEGSITFENMYIQFLDHFQATSYCDPTFGALIMVPLSQKYDLRWRQMVWSEHLSVLRFIQCTDDQLFSSYNDYVSPIETDETMLKYYYQALNTISLAEGSIPHRIATHHLRHSKFGKALKLQ